MADHAFQVPADVGGSTRYQLLAAEPPALDVYPFDEPVPDPSFLLSGQVTGAASVWATGDSGEPQYGTISAEGQFEIPVTLEPGPNTFAVEAADLCGTTSEPVEVTVVLGRTADVELAAGTIVAGEPATEAVAGVTVELRVRAADSDDNPIAEPQHLYMSVPDGVVDLDGDDVGDPGAAVSEWVNDGEGSWQWAAVSGEPGTYAVSLRLVRAGLHPFQFVFESPDQFGSAGLAFRVRPDMETKPLGMRFRIGTGAFGEEVAVSAERAARVEARLTDRFGNAVSLFESYTVQIECSAGNCDWLSVRNSADGPEITRLEIQSTATFYLVTGFTSIDPGTGDPTGDVSATLNVYAGP